jgi:plasmid stabilization system protein ParE
MATLIVSAQAGLDAAAAVAFLAEKAGSGGGARHAGDIEYLFERLMMFPASRARRPALGRAPRISIITPCIVIYDHPADDVIALRILDGRRNITRRLACG